MDGILKNSFLQFETPRENLRRRANSIGCTLDLATIRSGAEEPCMDETSHEASMSSESAQRQTSPEPSRKPSTPERYDRSGTSECMHKEACCRDRCITPDPADIGLHFFASINMATYPHRMQTVSHPYMVAQPKHPERVGSPYIDRAPATDRAIPVASNFDREKPDFPMLCRKKTSWPPTQSTLSTQEPSRTVSPCSPRKLPGYVPSGPKPARQIGNRARFHSGQRYPKSCTLSGPADQSASSECPLTSDQTRRTTQHIATACRNRSDAVVLDLDSGLEPSKEPVLSSSKWDPALHGYYTKNDILKTELVSESMRTTVMMKNIPNKYTQQLIMQLIHGKGFKASYDFLYLPMDKDTGSNMGYCFINFSLPDGAQRFIECFTGFHDWDFTSSKVCEVAWSRPDQGLASHIDRYRNSPTMSVDTPDDFKPAVFFAGQRIAFPPPAWQVR